PSHGAGGLARGAGGPGPLAVDGAGVGPGRSAGHAVDDRGALDRGRWPAAGGDPGLGRPGPASARPRPRGPHRGDRGRHRPCAGRALGAGGAAADRLRGGHQRRPSRRRADPPGRGRDRGGGLPGAREPSGRGRPAGHGSGPRRDRAPRTGGGRPGRIGCDRRRSLAGPGASSRPPPLPHHIEGGSRMSDPIRVLVADDHPAVLSGLVTLLDSAPDITVVAQAVDGTSALRAAQQHRPDVVLTDVRMPGATGIDITPRLRGTGASVLVISGFDLDEYVLDELAARADEYLVMSEDPDRSLAAVRDVHRADAVLTPAATRAVVSALHEAEAPGSSPARTSGRAPGQADPAPGPRGNSGSGPGSGSASGPGSGPGSGSASGPGSGPAMIPAFTRREEDVLAFLAQGLSNQQIASKMFVEVSTVKSHISHVLNKLGLDSRVQAALWWQQNRD